MNSPVVGPGPTKDGGLKLRMRGEERRISSQHRQLEELFERVLETLRVGGPRMAVGEFLLFSTALEAHMSVEEDIYFPALHGLRSDVAQELTSLVEDHHDLRRELSSVNAILRGVAGDAATTALEALAGHVDRHERIEEELIARITEGPVSGIGQTSLGS